MVDREREVFVRVQRRKERLKVDADPNLQRRGEEFRALLDRLAEHRSQNPELPNTNGFKVRTRRWITY